jgi:hypothetical protein
LIGTRCWMRSLPAVGSDSLRESRNTIPRSTPKTMHCREDSLICSAGLTK